MGAAPVRRAEFTMPASPDKDLILNDFRRSFDPNPLPLQQFIDKAAATEEMEIGDFNNTWRTDILIFRDGPPSVVFSVRDWKKASFAGGNFEIFTVGEYTVERFTQTGGDEFNERWFVENAPDTPLTAQQIGEIISKRFKGMPLAITWRRRLYVQEASAFGAVKKDTYAYLFQQFLANFNFARVGSMSELQDVLELPARLRVNNNKNTIIRISTSKVSFVLKNYGVPVQPKAPAVIDGWRVTQTFVRNRLTEVWHKPEITVQQALELIYRRIGPSNYVYKRQLYAN